MPELRTLLDREARAFDLPPDLWDRTRRVVNRRQLHRRVSASLVALAVAPSPYPQWDPAVSPDGSTIAYRGFFGPEEGDYDLYVMNADGTGVARLTDGALAADPSWSPDGSEIAFGTSGNGGIPGQFV